jgi:hypothetical protein
MTLPPNRRWFQWSLRTLFVVVTALCVWLGYHLNWIRERHALLDEPNVTASFLPMQHAPSFSLRLLGERGANSVFLEYPDWVFPKSSESDEAQKQKQRSARFFPEAEVRVWTGTVRFADDPGKPAHP